ncbi:MAG: lipopolysaccharide heptosyltransferase II [candidate division KSB1 bacterium]|nr:lipopolysaccharide heptosyltransferase II [candidate division KSB1 bacterium]MDZ7275151.1 lipopolysaccharide heptosyltransferase II [candidate division KSB1 bacterium]MDZ7287320.1 lipopolysaccharide heptosyltransferase II [candidate division KSB1 bacterium]MDZ7299434.1 lipopolysaccharide heptosyltransferase II [candidate division KSB1 bacterium]MDZ7308743.1 lipopolysaccharide heptosyltransferase II [candidate division KSB1 bacterium]
MASTATFKKILVIKLRAIGDVILATPVLDNLAAALPGTVIDFLTEAPAAPIVQNHPAVHEVIVLERRAASWRKPLALLHDLRRRRYDLVIDLFGNPRSALLTFATGARVRVGYKFRVRRFAYNHPVTPRGDRVHEVEFNLDALRHLGLPVVSRALHVEVAAGAQKEIDAWWQQQAFDHSRPVIGLNVSGGWYTKRWPLASFAALGDRLTGELAARVILLWGSRQEREEATAILEMMRTPALLAPPTSLMQAAALLARLHLLVSNDSGPLHLAAAMRTPVVGIYGPTRPELQGPWGEGHQVVRREGLACLGCNGVTCRLKTHDCMQKLEVAQVLAAVKSSLAMQPLVREVAEGRAAVE